ncbi:hypothetical protein KUTeg_012849 [Tegillarca granosa]|uniref:Monocarboxylate transporter 14 n=1 Tax=Tegillarca granosa TaxID=220873 RepID=A0ABQ9EW51_TEGGR|nr:hypothetical protein KUTeg_012849 [Tegillarca granosa]
MFYYISGMGLHSALQSICLFFLSTKNIESLSGTFPRPEWGNLILGIKMSSSTMEDNIISQNTESCKITPEHIKSRNLQYNRPEGVEDRDTESFQYIDDTGGLRNKPIEPDGGYGWVIVFCSFMFPFCMDGIGSVYSLLLPEINTALNTVPAISSMGNSFLFGSVFLIGVGLGMYYLSSIIMVNSYFTRKRGIALGVCNSGAGFGVITFSQLARILLDVYGWRGTILLLSGFEMQLCVGAVLMRPLYVKSVIDSKSSTDDNTENLLVKTKHLEIQLSNEKPENVQTSHSSTPNMTTHISFLKPDSVKYQSMQCIKTSTDQSSRLHELNPLFRKDIFYSGSLYNLPDQKT